jgi:hypothetical protein
MEAAKYILERIAPSRRGRLVICCRFGISRATADRRHQYPLSLIAWRLNGRSPPAKRARSFLVERMRISHWVDKR